LISDRWLIFYSRKVPLFWWLTNHKYMMLEPTFFFEKTDIFIFRPSTLVLIQNGIFHPSHSYSLLYILFFYTHLPLNLSFIPTIWAHFNYLSPSPHTASPHTQPPSLSLLPTSLPPSAPPIPPHLSSPAAPLPPLNLRRSASDPAATPHSANDPGKLRHRIHGGSTRPRAERAGRSRVPSGPSPAPAAELAYVAGAHQRGGPLPLPLPPWWPSR
jgi:hypothetical protein